MAALVLWLTQRIHGCCSPEEEQKHLQYEGYQRPKQGEDHGTDSSVTDRNT